MRRSNSTSHIPIFKTEIRRRSKSTARTSKDNLQAPTSAVKKNNERMGLKRSNSFQLSLKRTPSVSLSTPSSHCKQLKSPFKLSSATKQNRPTNDKQWIAEQFSKVRSFLLSINCDEGMLNSLKSPTIGIFVEIMKILFAQLEINLELNTINYKEIILAKMKCLKFPGTISMSFLKTVNTNYNWPQVVSIWSWLVDLIIAVRLCIEKYQESDNITAHMINYLSERYNSYNNGNEKECKKDLDRSFTDKLNRIFEIDDNYLNKLSKEVSELTETEEKQESHLAKQQETIQNNGDRIRQVETFITDLYQKKREVNVKPPSEYQCHQNSNIPLDERIETVKQNIKILESIVEKQLCSPAAKQTLLNEISEMKHTKSLKQDKEIKLKQIKSDFDYKLMDLKKQIENKVYELNTSLMQPILLNPDLEVLKLRDTGFFSPDFINEVDKCAEAKEKLANTLNEELKQLKEENIQITEEVFKKNHENEKLQIEIQQLEEQIKTKKHKIKTIEDAQKLELENIEAQIAKLNDQIGKIISDDPKTYQLELEKALEIKAALQINFYNAGIKNTEFIQKIHNMHADLFNEMNQIRVNLISKFVEEVNDTACVQGIIEKNLKRFESIKK